MSGFVLRVVFEIGGPCWETPVRSGQVKFLCYRLLAGSWNRMLKGCRELWAGSRDASTAVE